MKSFQRHFFTIVIGALASSAACAYVSGKTAVQQNLTYCPAEIECTEEGQINSCRLLTDNLDTWGPLIKLHVMGKDEETEIVPGKYTLVRVDAPYHQNGPIGAENRMGFYAPTARGVPECFYSMNDHGEKKYIAVQAKFETNLEAYYDKSTNWESPEEVAECQRDPAQHCPVTEKQGFVVYNKNLISGIILGINGIEITEKIPAATYSNVIYEDVLVACGSAQFCTIQIMSPKHASYGSITVDMDQKVKIGQIDEVRHSAVSIERIGTYNAIEVSYPSVAKH